jgi:thioredoxin 1
MDPILDELEQEYKGKDVEFAKVDVDQNQELASRLGVMSIPTFIVEKDGQEIGRKIGVTSKEELKKLLDS